MEGGIFLGVGSVGGMKNIKTRMVRCLLFSW